MTAESDFNGKFIINYFARIENLHLMGVKIAVPWQMASSVLQEHAVSLFLVVKMKAKFSL